MNNTMSKEGWTWSKCKEPRPREFLSKKRDHGGFCIKNRPARARSTTYQINQIVKEQMGGNGSRLWNVCTCANGGPRGQKMMNDEIRMTNERKNVRPCSAGFLLTAEFSQSEWADRAADARGPVVLARRALVG